MTCSKDLTFEECELAILRVNADKIEKQQGKILVESPETKTIIKLVESFIKQKKLIIYGGTAINNILPESDRFYDYGYELPDYDFFSEHALEDAKELADLCVKEGFTNIEAKAGVHHGTYKVFVNNLGIADITYLHPEIFNCLLKDIIRIKGLLYAPANFLRQSMYLELSRPKGDVSRWEKVLKRLTLLNKYYPLKLKPCKSFQRKMETDQLDQKKIFSIVKRCFIDEKLVFIGGYANALYAQYLPNYKIQDLPDFDVLSEDPEKTCDNVKNNLEREGLQVKINKYPEIGELISEHYSIQIGEEYIAFVYKPTACHSYNEIKIGKNKESVRIGTLDTLLSFYMAFMYADREYYDINRLLCLSTMLFNVQQRFRLKQSGLLKRFGMDCYGIHVTLSDIRDLKTEKRKKLDFNSKEYEEWFLNYNPLNKSKNKSKKKKKKKKQTKKKK
jgi:hypothetical protein